MSRLVPEPPKKRGRPVKISPETWSEIKAAKVNGASDREIVETFKVSKASLMRFLIRE